MTMAATMPERQTSTDRCGGNGGRGRVLMLFVMLFALVAAGCSSSRTDSAATAAQPSGSYPVTIDHRYGSTTLEQKPSRVVVIGLQEQDTLIALGTVPVAVMTWDGYFTTGVLGPWSKDLLGDRQAPAELSFAADGAPPYEEIANLKPDLIVGLYSDLTDTQYARLSQIAPTLAQPKDTNDYAATWEQITPILAQALDEKAKGDELLAQTREKIAETKSAYPQFEGKTGLSVYRNEDGYSVSAATDPRGQFLQMLGFTQSAAVKDALGENFDATISFERADLIDADVLVWEPKDVAALKAELAADPIFSRLRVAREDRSVFIQGGSDASCAYYFASVLSIPYLLDRLAPQLAVALDGNPDTVPAIVS
ncbi:iron-siderophore ABC transporter substrate-binding protein [Mycolicibacterium neoaurum]|uniref:iron-siderophore ABC transporter substrate-binding protein n=1 Tax=Mycolicibacterium neoaurum TaxID=1795 RepID=UPI0024090DB0|nr:iron-siderophore ABC transporter substrate-binding protein [Mycolicibacterium neoaurum]